MSANLYDVFRERFPTDRSALALEAPQGRRWSYGDLDAAVACIAGYLTGLGVAPGDRVAVQVEKSPEAVLLYLACLRAGFVYLPLNTAYPAGELAYFLGDSEPAAFVCRPGDLTAAERLAAEAGVARVLTLGATGEGTLVEGVRRAPGVEESFETVAREPDDVACILYTSGTTGQPKGAMLSHGNLSSNALTLHEAWGWRSGDVLLHALPIFHTHGLFVALGCALLNGSPVLLLPRFDARVVIDLLPRATVFMGVPTFYTRLLAESDLGRDACAGMRLFVSGSAPLLERTFAEFRERTGHAILERYGMTECGMSTSNPLDGERRPGTVGPPLPGVRLRVVDEAGREVAPGEVGSIEFTGPHVFLGYWRNPDKTAEEFTDDGYFRSGDLGTLSEDGYVSIVGRGKDLVISGGFNVYPKEVELVLDALPEIHESAVIGLAHADFGEQVTAVIVPERSGAAPAPEAIIESLRPRLAGYKIPRRYEFVDELPRNAMGKVQKNLLRKRFGET